MAHPLTGARPLLKVALHQDRINIAPWVMLISVLSASSILAYRWVFPDAADRQGLATAIAANPAMGLVFGTARDLSTNDGFNAWRAGMLGAFFAGLMAILVVVRNSRGDEDSGRAELIASGVISRQARLVVAVLMATVAAVALGVVCFLLTWASGGEVLPTFVLSATFTVSALVFAGVAAVAAQLGADARTASTLAIGTLGVLYVVRGYIDSSDTPDWARWLTPFGWFQEAAPATDNQLWPLLPALGLAVLLVGVALVLQEHRDYGLGMVAERPGAARAPRLGVAGLAWRLHRGAVLTWLVAFAFLGLVFGTLATTIGDVIKGNPAMAAILASGAVSTDELSFAFVATVLQIVGIIAAVMGAQVVQRVRTEELEHRVEPLLAAPLRRPAYLLSNVLLALAATAVAMLLAGTVIGIVASTSEVDIAFGDVLLQAACTIPAVWVLVAVSVAVVGAHPAKRFVGWLVIIATFGLTLLGPTFKLPEWALGISPLHHVPVVVTDDPGWLSLVVLLGITLLLVAVGVAGFRRRDVG